jgi:sulfite dehydrogenase
MWRMKVVQKLQNPEVGSKGSVKNSLSLSLDDLKASGEQVELVAVNQYLNVPVLLQAPCRLHLPGTMPISWPRPISTLPVRSFVTSVTAGDVLPVGQLHELKGIAFDSGFGIKVVDVSTDGGRTWRTATLGEDLGRFSFRQWRMPVTFAQKGEALLMVRATNNRGEQQSMKPNWNPGGYQRQVVETTPLLTA